ncbi:stage II sporulation protein M [Hymenobacter ginsengisoli]|uniref:Stage II sporulation protein M n=1 Tax=Hymenobacter ginsengisoli TaxID=1051626 RepID=A0ABP8QR99_9BACT|nr:MULTISPECIES: stage II sporulation protein M [unclassified Hymenobacter]MBO2032227.1 stage II sporulation protein M [Hymenobacter sp. BT559]
MREAVFLRQNQARWHLYETQPPANPDELATRFVALTDDLAYAQTFYPASPTTAYLNTLAGKLQQTLYRNKPEEGRRLAYFWAVEVPLVVARHQRALAWAMGLFVLFTALGALSAAYDADFLRVVLGDDYVNQTLANIRRGDPMAIYKTGGSAVMFVGIAANNLFVALRTFALGATLGLGTLYSLFFNGLMLGAFQYFFYQQHVLLPSLLTIWIHGTLEIPSIVLAGGAGFILGGGLLFPGTYTRRESLARAARDAVKLALGLVPVIVAAAFLESFVTRHTEMPLALSLAIIGGSAAFIIWYFGIYPRVVQRRVLPLPLIS